MKNIVTTIPRNRYNTWQDCERDLLATDGSEKGGFWLINTTHLPKNGCIGTVCFMVFDGQVRGYFDVVDTQLTEDCRSFHRIGKRRTTQSIIMANWHPISRGNYLTGFQGWRYTALRP